jgi:hypothetical protein
MTKPAIVRDVFINDALFNQPEEFSATASPEPLPTVAPGANRI